MAEDALEDWAVHERAEHEQRVAFRRDMGVGCDMGHGASDGDGQVTCDREEEEEEGLERLT